MKGSYSATVAVILSIFVFITVVPAGLSFADAYLTKKITDNSSVDSAPSLHDGKIAWQGTDGDYEIYYWDGANTAKVTNNSYSDSNPSLYDGEIAWRGNGCLYFWDGNSAVMVSTNYPDWYGDPARFAPSLYNGTIAWEGYTTQGAIYYWDGNSITLISNMNFGESTPSLYDGTIAWTHTSWGGSEDIIYWDGHSNFYPTNSHTNYGDYAPSLYDGEIAYQYSNEILLWNGNSTINVSANSSVDSAPSLYNGEIAWQGNADGDWDIYYWNGTITTKITDNSSSDTAPSLYNGEIAWVGTEEGDSDIYYARLASAWIYDALADVALLDFTESEILALSDIYSSQSSGMVHGTEWTYISGDLPGDINGEVYDIGDSWQFGRTYYIKLGSGLVGLGEGLGGGTTVPELPPATAGVILMVLLWIPHTKKYFSYRVPFLSFHKARK